MGEERRREGRREHGKEDDSLWDLTGLKDFMITTEKKKRPLGFTKRPWRVTVHAVGKKPHTNKNLAPF